MNRMMRLAVGLILCGWFAAPASAQKTFAQDFGVSGPILAAGNEVTVTYLGWDAATYYGHTIWALTGTEYADDLANGCFDWAIAASCSAIAGEDVGTKPFGPATDPYLSSPLVTSFSWTQGDEIIFALQVNQGDGYNWFFSGDPSRNNDDLAHLAFFSAANYPGGVPGDKNHGVVPQTAGLSLFGFEDVTYQDSDWDFDDAIFGVGANDIGIPTNVTPEPGTLALVATGLLTLAAAGARRRNRVRT